MVCLLFSKVIRWKYYNPDGKNSGNLYEVEMTHNTYSTMLTSDNDLTEIKNYVLCAILVMEFQ